MVFLFTYTKAEIHIWFNAFHTENLDTFFRYYTHAGDGATAGVIVFILLFIKYRKALQALVALIGSAIFAYFFKHFIFGDMPRPMMFFSSDDFFGKAYTLYIAEGYNPGIWYPFPSGHSTTAFAIFGVLALMVEKKAYKLLFFILALSSAYSRVYLSNHFLMDITAGAALGTLIAFFAYFLIGKLEHKKLEWSILRKMKS